MCKFQRFNFYTASSDLFIGLLFFIFLNDLIPPFVPVFSRLSLRFLLFKDGDVLNNPALFFGLGLFNARVGFLVYLLLMATDPLVLLL